MDWFKKLLKRNNYPNTQNQAEYAFASGGIDYYQLSDINNLPALRGMKTLVFFEEMRMKCSMEYLKMHADAVDAILLKPNINIYDLKKLNDQLKQRLTIAVDLEAVYKLASIVFFDKNENIADYDYAYNAKKIARWKKNEGAAFFLLKPVAELVPALKDMGGNLQNYLEVQQDLNQLHSANLSLHLPEKKMQK